MTIHLPDDLEISIRSVIHSGRFGSLDDAMAEAARLLLRELGRGTQTDQPSNAIDPGHDPIPGSINDGAEQMVEAASNAMGRRQDMTRGPSGGGDASPTPLPRKPIWEVVEELRRGVPPEEFAKLPDDGAEQLDHYLYGSPKRPKA